MVVGLVAAAAILAGCVPHQGQLASPGPAVQTPQWRLVEDIRYVPADWPEPLTGDLFLPDGPASPPVVLLVHGGGWEGGEPENLVSIAERLVRRGYAVFNVQYRLAPEYEFPAPVHDLQMAVRWLRTQSQAYDLQTDHIAGFGYSAGAHLVLMLGLISDGDALDSPWGGAETRLQAVVAGAGPTDLRKFEGGRLVPQFLGSSLQAAPELFAMASPVTHVDEGDPPVFVYHGGLDWLVSVDHARDLKTALDAAGVPAELYVSRWLGHISLFLFDGGAVAAATDFLDATLRSEASAKAIE
ncbi:MAG: lipase [Salinisphaeraceae bacterium]|nr:lipase [Salinisphaeraceae bacterium]